MKDGGSAFPITGFRLKEGGVVEDYIEQPGMSLRDWFAGQALTRIQNKPVYDAEFADTLARNAYLIADAMLAASAASK